MMTQIRRFALIVLTFAFLLPAGPAWANQTEQIEQLRSMLDQQDELDAEGAAKKDRDLARKWLQEAELLVANGKRDQAKRRLRRAEFAVELVTALVAAAVIQQKAKEQEAAAYSAPETKAELEAEVEKLRKRKAELQAELQKLSQYAQ